MVNGSNDPSAIKRLRKHFSKRTITYRLHHQDIRQFSYHSMTLQQREIPNRFCYQEVTKKFQNNKLGDLQKRIDDLYWATKERVIQENEEHQIDRNYVIIQYAILRYHLYDLTNSKHIGIWIGHIRIKKSLKNWLVEFSSLSLNIRSHG